MFLKKLLNTLLPDPDPQHSIDDDSSSGSNDTPLNVTPMDFTVHLKGEHICTFNDLTYSDTDDEVF